MQASIASTVNRAINNTGSEAGMPLVILVVQCLFGRSSSGGKGTVQGRSLPGQLYDAAADVCG